MSSHTPESVLHCKQHITSDHVKRFNDIASVIRKPLDTSSGHEYEKCGYAFFPGCQLGIYEPEIVIKVYDSLLFQHPDTAIFLQCCGLPASDGSGKSTEYFENALETIRESWIKMGKPVMITACPACGSLLKENFHDMSVISLYKFLIEHEISGGCNSSDYRIFDRCAPENIKNPAEDIKELANEMGVILHDETEDPFPYITYCINCRNSLKCDGDDAVHILELIYGMGESNSHLIHHHEHDDTNIQDDIHEPAYSHEPFRLLSGNDAERNMRELRQALLCLFWNETT